MIRWFRNLWRAIADDSQVEPALIRILGADDVERIRRAEQARIRAAIDLPRRK